MLIRRPSLWIGLLATALSLIASGCSKKEAPAATTLAPTPAPTSPALEPAEVVPSAPVAVDPDGAAAPAAVAEVAAVVDPRVNAWGVKAGPAGVSAGDRVYVLTKGRDRSMTDAKAVYQLFAHDVASVDGDLVTIAEIGGGTFDVAAHFVIAAGVADVAKLKVGQMVLAEWASSLKHAVVEGFEGPAEKPERVRIRYIDLPESWPDEKVLATRSPRELTAINEGMSPGNFALARDEGRDALVMLVALTPQGWLVQRFGGRVALLPATVLVAIPHAPKLRKGDKVRMPWVGMMMPGTVTRTRGTWVYAKVEGIGQKDPISAPIGHVVPEALAIAGVKAATEEKP